MLVLSSLHVHEIREIADTECVHDHCSGHLMQMTTHMHECVLCQFLTLPVLAAVVIAVTVFFDVCKNCYAPSSCGYLTACCGIIVTRGPPMQ